MGLHISMFTSVAFSPIECEKFIKFYHVTQYQRLLDKFEDDFFNDFYHHQNRSPRFDFGAKQATVDFDWLSPQKITSELIEKIQIIENTHGYSGATEFLKSHLGKTVWAITE